MFDSDLKDQNKALVRLLESADLVRMLEDLLSPASYSKLSGAVLSGVRVTLRNVREGILSSHDSIAGEIAKQSRVVPDSRPVSDPRLAAESRISDQKHAESKGITPADPSAPNTETTVRESAALQSDDLAKVEAGETIEFAAKTANGMSSHAAISVRRSDLRSSLQKIVERA